VSGRFDVSSSGLPLATAGETSLLGVPSLNKWSTCWHVSRGAVSASRIGQPGNPSEVSRTITMSMNDAMRFTPDRIEVRTGETIRFELHNEGKLRHELVLGEPEALRRHAAMMQMMPDMQHSGPNMASLAPERGQLIWKFTRTGTVTFACLQSGNLEAGMKGAVAVQ
jgi:uncharacterized cupredoxin-like copper-binding protein